MVAALPLWIRSAKCGHQLPRAERRRPGILYLLQQNARDATIETMGEAVGASASPVRNRIDGAVARDVDHLADTSDSPAGLGLDVQNTLCSQEAHTQSLDHFGADVPREYPTDSALVPTLQKSQKRTTWWVYTT